MSVMFVVGMVALGAVGAMAALPWGLRWMRRRRTRRAWLELSPKLELPLSRGTNERLLSGRYRGHPVEVRLTAQGTSQVRVPLKTALPVGLHLSRQEPGVTLRPRRGMRDIQVGDPDLDKAFLIQGRNPAAIIRLLREPDVREALLALQADSPRALITENEVLVPLESPVQEEPCRRALRSTTLLTSALVEATARQQALAETARAQARRDLPPLPSPRPAGDAPTATASQTDELSSPGNENFRLAFIRDEFARRMRIHSWLGTYPMGASFIVFFICALVSKHSKTMFGLPLSYWSLSTVGIFVGGLLGHYIISHKLLLCPACGQDVIEPDPEKQKFLKGSKGGDGIIITLTLSTDICPHCRTVLS